MANHSKFIKLLLSFVIAVSPILLINNANAAIGGWTLSNPVAQGASVLYDGAKNVLINGKNVAKTSTALITPTATQVAKVLARGVAGYALSIAVEQLLGAVDWVLDPANNQIVYTEKCEKTATCPQFLYSVDELPDATFSSAKSACNAMIAFYNKEFAAHKYVYTFKSVTGTTALYCNFKLKIDGVSQPDSNRSIYKVANPAYDPNAEKETKTLPLPVVAEKVISNAQSSDTNAQVATVAAAADIVAEAETDSTKARPITKQLEANAETATDETATGESVPKDPTAPDATKPTNISLEFPKFCGWAPSVCEAAQVVISFPTLVTEWWETANTKADGWATSISQSWAAAKEWATSEPSQDNTQVDVENNNTQEIDTQVSFSTQCPAPINLANFSYHGISQSWTVDFSKFCDVFATYLKPVVISIGAFSAVLIVSGVGVRENG